MKLFLDESSILNRMTREEAANVKGGGLDPALDSICGTPDPPVGALCVAPVDSLCIKPIKFADCLLSGCGCRPSQTDCNQCAASPNPGMM